MISNANLSATEKSSLLSQSPSSQKPKADSEWIGCCVISGLIATAAAGTISGGVGLFSACDELGNNSCTILSSTATGIGVLALFTLTFLCICGGNNTPASKKRNIKVINNPV